MVPEREMVAACEDSAAVQTLREEPRAAGTKIKFLVLPPKLWPLISTPHKMAHSTACSLASNNSA